MIAIHLFGLLSSPLDVAMSLLSYKLYNSRSKPMEHDRLTFVVWKRLYRHKVLITYRAQKVN